MNGSWVKWVVGTMAPIVLALGIWVGDINARVARNTTDVQSHKTSDNKKFDKISEIDKKVTAILCKIDPENCGR